MYAKLQYCTNEPYQRAHLQVGNPLVREHTQFKFKLKRIQKHICEQVNRTKFLKERMKNYITPGKCMTGGRPLRVEKHTSSERERQ